MLNRWDMAKAPAICIGWLWQTKRLPRLAAKDSPHDFGDWDSGFGIYVELSNCDLGFCRERGVDASEDLWYRG